MSSVSHLFNEFLNFSSKLITSSEIIRQPPYNRQAVWAAILENVGLCRSAPKKYTGRNGQAHRSGKK